MTCKDQIKIKKIFSEIGEILDKVNGTRKRMISINFIIRKVLSMMNLPFDKLPLTKSKKTMASYEKYWKQINELIGDKIKEIITK